MIEIAVRLRCFLLSISRPLPRFVEVPRTQCSSDPERRVLAKCSGSKSTYRTAERKNLTGLFHGNDGPRAFAESDLRQTRLLRIAAQYDPVAIRKKGPNFATRKSNGFSTVLHLKQAAFRAFLWPRD